MAYKAKAYTLREESTESGTRYFISFKDGQGKSHELEVSEQFFMEFRQMERRNRNLLQWDERHREFNEVWDETLYRRALRVPKSLDERMVEEERNETLYKAVGSLPEIQRRRFLLYYEYEFNFYQIAAMEHCTASAIQKSVAIAKEKVKAEIEEISPTVTDTAKKEICFLFVWDWRHYILSLFSVGVNLFLRRSTPMCNKNKITARKEETHAEVTDSQRRNAPL